MSATRILKGALALVVCLAGSFLTVEFAVPSLRSSARETLGREPDLQVEFITRRSPFLKRIVAKDLRIKGRTGSLARTQGDAVCDHVWKQRKYLEEGVRLDLRTRVPSYPVRFVMWVTAEKTEDRELKKFIDDNSPDENSK